ncbi:MAG: ligase [Rhodospirillales bacterium]|nr:ligase [Rhodospirillales bacterium]
MTAAALKSRAKTETLSGARLTSFPGFIEFCHPKARAHPPSGAEWIHEIKVDGYRAQLEIQNGVIKVLSRRAFDWSATQFAAIAKAAAFLRAHDCIVDGEAVVLNATGKPDFNLLRQELGNRNSKRLQFFAFDLLYLDGYDLRQCRLEDRKEALRHLLSDAPKHFVYVEPFEEDGARVFEHACRLGLEGVVSKRRDSPYRSGEQASWIKVKCKETGTYPIVAFVEKLGAKPRRVASLYIGRWEGDRLLYAGKVRSGHTETLARELRERLDPLISGTSPLSQPIAKPKATWVRPGLLAEVQYGAINDGGILREAVFKGLRDDLAEPVALSGRPAAKRSGDGNPHVGVSQAHILQLLPDAVAPSKEELRAYWTRVWKRALPYLEHRPLKLVRHVHGTTFYHKGQLPETPPEVHALEVEKREGGIGTRLWVDSLAGLLGLVEIGAVELHPWNATVDDIERADRLVIDLDPGDGVPWSFVVETALRLRDTLRSAGLRPWPKLTGGKGIHLMAPFARKMTHDAARALARNFVQDLAGAEPDRYTTSPDPALRHGRIYLDYLRNGRGNTAVGAYSPRVRPGFPVAAPVTWRQIEQGLRPDAFTMSNPPRSGARAGKRDR